MEQLEESTRLILDEYRRRFGDLPDVPVVDLDIEMRGMFVAALERALNRNMPLLDYELQQFELSRWHRAWLRLRQRVARLTTRRTTSVL